MRLLYYIGLSVMLLLLPAQAFETVTPSAHHLMAMYTNERPYRQVAWLTSHNAYANARDGWRYTQQTGGIKEQFDYGVRSFMIDVHPYDPGTDGPPYLALCHGECPNPWSLPSWAPTGLVSKLPPTPFNVLLTDIYELLKAFPRDILTLHIESGTPDNATDPALQIGPYLTKAGLDPYLLHLAPENVDPNDSALTLGKMREENRRLVVFSDKPHDDVFPTTLYRETQYSLRDYSGCEMREDERDTNRSTQLFVFNHFYTFSYESPPEGFDETNSFWKIQKRLKQCRQQEGIYPTFVTVDFVEEGSYGGAREVVLWLNLEATNRNLTNTASTDEPVWSVEERREEKPFSYEYWGAVSAAATALAVCGYVDPRIRWPAAVAESVILAALFVDSPLNHYIPATLSQYALPFGMSLPFSYYVSPYLLGKVAGAVPVVMGGLRRYVFPHVLPLLRPLAPVVRALSQVRVNLPIRFVGMYPLWPSLA